MSNLVAEIKSKCFNINQLIENGHVNSLNVGE